MKRKRVVWWLLFLVCSCTSTYRIDLYQLNKRYVTQVGAPMVARENCWGDTYYEAATLKDCFLRQELLYSGKEGNVIHMTYKEYARQDGGYSSVESFLQDVGYDLRQSDIISYRDIYFKVIEANETSIDFMVIDPVTYFPYPP